MLHASLDVWIFGSREWVLVSGLAEWPGGFDVLGGVYLGLVFILMLQIHVSH